MIRSKKLYRYQTSRGFSSDLVIANNDLYYQIQVRLPHLFFYSDRLGCITPGFAEASRRLDVPGFEESWFVKPNPAVCATRCQMQAS
jgi:hypothetical protein